MNERWRPRPKSRQPLHAERGVGGRLIRTPLIDLSRTGEGRRSRTDSSRSVDARGLLRTMDRMKDIARSSRRRSR